MRNILIFVTVFFFGGAAIAQAAGPIRERIRERIKNRIEKRAENAQKESQTDSSTDSMLTINVNGTIREYLLHVPPSSQNGSGLPLVLFFHGAKSTPKGMDRLTGFNAVADRENFVVVYPKGIDQRWNDGRGSDAATADDLGFVKALIDHLHKEIGINLDRIYATGISNGGMMSHFLACRLSDKISAIASVAGSLPEDVMPNCTLSKKVPVLMIHGTDDPLISWKGGVAGKRGQAGGGPLLSVPKTIEFWANKNGCGNKAQETKIADKARDRTSTVKIEFCSDAILYKVINGGHTWPGGNQYAPEFLIGKTSQDFNATQTIVDFFKQH